MSATKTVGFIALIGIGIFAVWYFLNKKVEAAEIGANAKLDSLTAGLKGSVAGVAAAIGTGLKTVIGGKAASGAVGAAGTAASAAAFVGPVQPAVTGTGYVGAMTTAGIVGAVATGAIFLYSAFRRLFPASDPEWDAIERKLQAARDAGRPIVSVVSRASLKAPWR